MNNTRTRALRAIVFAVVIALGGASPALAASTSSTVTETLEVTASISMTGVPASLAYSSVNAGQKASAPEFTANVSSNHSTGWNLSVTATDLTASGGALVIAKGQRGYVINGTGFTRTGGGSEAAYPAAGGAFVLASRATAGTNDVFITSRVNVPADAAPGAYAGSAVFTASTNP